MSNKSTRKNRCCEGGVGGGLCPGSCVRNSNENRSKLRRRESHGLAPNQGTGPRPETEREVSDGDGVQEDGVRTSRRVDGLPRRRLGGPPAHEGRRRRGRKGQ